MIGFLSAIKLNKTITKKKLFLNITLLKCNEEPYSKANNSILNISTFRRNKFYKSNIMQHGYDFSLRVNNRIGYKRDSTFCVRTILEPYK